MVKRDSIWQRVARKLSPKLRMSGHLALISLTALVSTLLSTPTWAPENPWRFVAEVPVVRGPESSIPGLLADFLDLHHLRLAPSEVYDIAQSVTTESARHGIDPGLLLSIILSESRFRVDAVSEKGAVGLMQLLPSTAEAAARELDLEWGGDARLLDPRTNIALGTYYFRKLMDVFNDDVSLALTAYNKGPGYVLRMQASGVMEASAADFPSAYAEEVMHGVTALRAGRGRSSDKGELSSHGSL